MTGHSVSDEDIRALTGQPPDRSLDTLEADVWKGVDARLETNRTSRLVLSCQALVVGAAILVSLMAGTQIGHALAKDVPQHGLFATGMEHAPSTLLLGHPT
jgi:hypothetical protein